MRRLWLRLRAAWVTLTGTGAAASVAFGLLVFASVLASLAIPRESVGLSNGALQRVIAASRPGDRTVIATVPETSMTDEIGQVQATDITAVGASVRARLAAGGMPVASNPPAWASLTTGFVPVTGATQAAGDGRPQFEMTYRTDLARYSQIVAGAFPAGGSAPGEQIVVQAAVTTTTAARFGLGVGTRLNAGPVQLVISGIIRPTNPAAAFWSEDLIAARPLLTQAASPQLPYWTGAVFIGSGAPPLIEGTIGTGEMQVTWVYTAALGRLTAGQADELEASVNSLASSGATVLTPAGNPVTVTIASQIPAILSPFVAGQNAVAPALELLYVSLTIIGAVVVLLGARLVAQRRAAEFTLMRARGAALYQLTWLVLRASVVIVAAAGAAAAALAIGLTPGDGDAVAWWLAGITIAVTLVGPVLISVVPQRVAAPATGRAGGGGAVPRGAGRRAAARRIIVEIALVAVAVGGLVVLRNEGLSSGNSGLYTSAAPVLVAIPVAVVLLRCYPLLARELARIAGRSRGVVAFVGLARATRTPPGTVLPAFALVLVLSMVAFTDMVSTSVIRSQVAASWQQVGADAVIQAPPNQGIPPGLQGQISSLPGVVSTAAAEVDVGSLAAGTELSVMFVDPAQYAAVIGQAPGPRFPQAALSGAVLSGNGVIGEAGAIIPAVATPAAVQLVGTAPTSVNVGGNVQRHDDPADRTDRHPQRPQRPRRAHGRRRGGGSAGTRQPARAERLAGRRARAGCGAAERGRQQRVAGRAGDVPRHGPVRADHGAGATGGADGPHAGNSHRGRLRRAGPAAVAPAHRLDPRHDAGTPGDDGAAALAGPAAAGDRDASPGRGRRHRWCRVCLAACATGRAIAEPGGVRRDRVGRRGEGRRVPVGRFGGRAGAGRAARPGRSGRHHLPSRQHQGAADR